jgi:hypoxanthine phosphoribosyltransferase
MPHRMDHDIVEVLITREEIEQRVSEMGKELTVTYEGSSPLFVGVLKGSSMFLADLVRHIDIPLEIDFIGIASYGSTQQSSGAVRISKDLDSVIEGRDVVLVDSLVDTGMTIGYLLRNLEVRQPRSIRLCAFLDKRVRRIVDVPISFRGFEIPDRFVVGYGLDFRQLYRNLPYVGVLSGELTGLRRR